MASQSSAFDAFMPSSSVLLVVIAWVLVLASAVAVVMVTHVNRQQLHQLQLLRREAADLQVVWGQYLLEGAALGAYSRIGAAGARALWRCDRRWLPISLWWRHEAFQYS